MAQPSPPRISRQHHPPNRGDSHYPENQPDNERKPNGRRGWTPSSRAKSRIRVVSHPARLSLDESASPFYASGVIPTRSRDANESCKKILTRYSPDSNPPRHRLPD